jgi:hypothetical protein
MNAYSEITKNALVQALAKSAERQTRADRILLLLAPGEWVDSLALALNGGGLDFTARICELRKSGVRIETRRNPASPKGEQWFQYRLTEVDDPPSLYAKECNSRRVDNI